MWIGATVGMVLADGMAIAVGRLLHRRLPERFLHGVAALLFLLFGLWLLFHNALGWYWVAVVSTAVRYARSRRSTPASAPERESSPETAAQRPGNPQPAD